MTYVLAWKSGGKAFLCADSAITIDGEDKSRTYPSKSSFQEWHVFGDKRTVVERMLKIARFTNVAMAFSGDVYLADIVIGETKARIAQGNSPREAFQLAIMNCSPIERELQLVLCIQGQSYQEVLTFDSSRNCDIEELPDNAWTYLGRFDEDLNKLIVNTIDQLLGMPPAVVLTRALAILQSFCIHSPLLSDIGVGGVFSGLWMDSEGIFWQPTTLNIIGFPKTPAHRLVIVENKSNATIVSVADIDGNETKVFLNVHSDTFKETLENIKAIDNKQWRTTGPSAIFYLNTRYPTVLDFQLLDGRSDYIHVDICEHEADEFSLTIGIPQATADLLLDDPFSAAPEGLSRYNARMIKFIGVPAVLTS